MTDQLTVVRKIVVHEKPHLDELVALYLLFKYGAKKFAGIADADIVFNRTGGDIAPNMSPEDRLAQHGILTIGTGGGPYDEHITGIEIIETCSATLVAEDLGVDKQPELQQLLRYTLITDTRGEQAEDALTAQFMLKNLVITLHQSEQSAPIEVMKMVFIIIDAFVAQQRRFYLAGREAIESGRIFPFVNQGNDHTLIAMNTENDMAKKAAFAAGHSLIIQQNEAGNVQVFVNYQSGIKLDELACALFIEEGLLNGQSISPSDPSSPYKRIMQFKKMERVPEVPEWFHYRAGRFLLNGSLTASDVPPTKLPLDKIIELALICYDESSWEDSHRPACLNGQCTHSSQPCSWYTYGLQRCHELRRKAQVTPV